MECGKSDNARITQLFVSVVIVAVVVAIDALELHSFPHLLVSNFANEITTHNEQVKPMVDEVTLQKISIVRGKDAVFAALAEKIPIENIPPEYGGTSMPLGESPEEHALRDLIRHNNALANGDFSCGGKAGNPPCRFCSWGPVRSY